jgi:hypothetical protein
VVDDQVCEDVEAFGSEGNVLTVPAQESSLEIEDEIPESIVAPTICVRRRFSGCHRSLELDPRIIGADCLFVEFMWISELPKGSRMI